MKILVYGSLRQGQYNFDRIRYIYGKDSIKFIETKEVPNYKMYDLGAFPAVYPGNTTDKILCEVMEVNDQAAQLIDHMELGAGYVGVDVEGMTLYVFKSPLDGKAEPVLNGDWTEYRKAIPEKN